MAPNIENDEITLVLRSRAYELQWSMRWTGLGDPPPEAEAVQWTIATFGPLFEGFASMPFGSAVITPLIQSTMDQLWPRAVAYLNSMGRFYRRSRRLLVPDNHPPVINFQLHGEAARQHMDDIEATLRQARQDPQFIPSFTGRMIRWQQRPPETVNWNQIFRSPPPPPAEGLLQDIERIIFYGEGARESSSQAVERSRETLLLFLSEAQKAQFLHTDSFPVVAQDGQVYTVTTSKTFNVRRGDWIYCAVPADQSCPVYDFMLASKLWLEAHFQEFMRIANRKHIYSGAFIAGAQEDTPPRHIWRGDELSVARPGAWIRLGNRA